MPGAAMALAAGRSRTPGPVSRVLPGDSPAGADAVSGGYVTDGGLTNRQLEVAILVAEGLTDKEIAMILMISEDTVAYHVQRIQQRWALDKTKNTRVQITRRILAA